MEVNIYSFVCYFVAFHHHIFDMMIHAVCLTSRGCDGLGPQELEDQVNSLKVLILFTCQLVQMYYIIHAFRLLYMVALNCKHHLVFYI